MNRLLTLGNLVKLHREHKEISQEYIAENCGVKTNRSAVAHLEQGIRLPRNDVLEAICKFLDIPKPLWTSFTEDHSLLRFEFENILTELTGRTTNIDSHDQSSINTLEGLIEKVFSMNPSQEQLRDIFNSILVYYGYGPVSKSFFKKYFSPTSFGSIESFAKSVDIYQIDAIRLYPTFSEAFDKMSSAKDIDSLLYSLNKTDLSIYENRNDWELITQIEDKYLADLGYISAKTVRQESNERQWLTEQIKEIADDIENKKSHAEVCESLTTKKRKKIDTLLRKFDSNILHGLSSPLFNYDHDFLRREADRLAPLEEERLLQMEQTQRKALENLSNYLSADYMDVYVATSMRSDADYISVNYFVKSLFNHKLVRPLKLRYFNPTQSWIDDRVAKGLVEALMLKRASITVYMAQKSDTFGKDSEASVALGQGKPVIVYVPKLSIKDEDIDSEILFNSNRAELIRLNQSLPIPEEIDDTIDDEALVSSILYHKIESCHDEKIIDCIREIWADFDLSSESNRIPEEHREAYRTLIEKIMISGKTVTIPKEIRSYVVGVLAATSINFEKRAKVFREVHPLALQVILSSGVLNGILVARTVSQCASVLHDITKNELELELLKDSDNYRVIEQNTKSTIRVISRHQLLRNAFNSFYKGQE